MPFALAAVLCACTSGGSGSQNPAPVQTQTGAPSASDNLLQAVKRRGVLVVATDANYKPQSFRNPDGSWVGFDVEVAREVAKRLGVAAQFESSPFDQVTAGDWNGHWDVNIGSMAITNARARVLWFTEPYYFTPASFAVRKDSGARSIKDLSGKRIGVAIATTYEDYLNGKMPTAREKAPSSATVITYPTDTLALQDLAHQNGNHLDAAMSALPTIHAAIVAGMPLRVIEPPVFEDSLAIALDRKSPQQSAPLLWAIDGIIHEMHKDGTLSRLSLKWYGIDISVRR